MTNLKNLIDFLPFEFKEQDTYKVDGKGVLERFLEICGNYFQDDITKDIDNIEVVTSDLLTVEYAKSINAVAMVRGLRMVSDFEYELQMATLNRCIDHNVETIFIMSSHQYSFLSSSSVKEIARFDGDISSFVPKNVEIALKNKLK